MFQRLCLGSLGMGSSNSSACRTARTKRLTTAKSNTGSSPSSEDSGLDMSENSSDLTSDSDLHLAGLTEEDWAVGCKGDRRFFTTL